MPAILLYIKLVVFVSTPKKAFELIFMIKNHPNVMSIELFHTKLQRI